MISTKVQLERWRKRTRIAVVIGTPCLLAAGVWAVWPLHAAPPIAPSPPEPVMAVLPSSSFDRSGFGAPIYRLIPKPVAAPAPPAPPLKLQLLAINTTRGGETTAILYDQDDDATAIVRDGGSYKGFSVSITGYPPTRVVLSSGAKSVTLSLDAGGAR
jgi:hypothetical protein